MATTPIQLTEREQGGLAQQLINTIQSTRNATQAQRDQLRRSRAYYRTYAEGDEYDQAIPPYPGATMLRSPVVEESTQAVYAELYNALLMPAPLHHVEACLDSMRGAAAWTEDVMERIVRQQRLLRVYSEWLRMSLEDGAAMLYYRYERTLRKRWGFDHSVTQIGTDALEAAYPSVASIGHIALDELRWINDLPVCTVIPIDRIFVAPAQDAQVQESYLVGAEWDVSIDQLRQGIIQKFYDADAVKNALASGSPDNDRLPEDQKREIASQTIYDKDYVGSYTSLPLKLMQVFVQREDPETKLSRDWVVTLHEPTYTILRAVPWDRPRPFVLMRPYTVGPGIYGNSIATQGAGYVQEIKTALWRDMIWAAERKVQPRLGIPTTLWNRVEQGLANIRRLNARIPLPDTFLKEGGQLLNLDQYGLNPEILMPIQMYADAEIQRHLGGSAARQINQPSGKTATASLQEATASNTMMAAVMSHCGEAIGDAAELLYSLVREYQEQPAMQEIFSTVNNPDNLQPHEALAGPFLFTSNGSTGGITKATKAKAAEAAIGLLQNDEYVWQNPESRYNLEEMFIRSLDVNYPDEILGTKPDYIQRAQQMQQAAAAGLMAEQQAKGGKNNKGTPPAPPATDGSQRLDPATGEQSPLDLPPQAADRGPLGGFQA